MSIEELASDLKGITARCPSGPLVTASEMADFQRNELLPFLGGVIEEMRDIDAALGAVVEHSEDLLHEESATTFAGIIEGGRKIADALQARLGPGDTELRTLVAEWRKLANEGAELLEEITYADPDDPDDEVDDDDTESESTEIKS